MLNAKYTQEDINNQITQYIEFEVLEKEHNAHSRVKQADYCANEINSCFCALVCMMDSADGATNAINEFSEKNYSAIEKRILKL